MIICLCKAVSDREVRHAICQGHRSLKAIAKTCGAGRGCGGCHEALRGMLAQTHGTPQPASSANNNAPDTFGVASLATTG